MTPSYKPPTFLDDVDTSLWMVMIILATVVVFAAFDAGYQFIKRHGK